MYPEVTAIIPTQTQDQALQILVKKAHATASNAGDPPPRFATAGAYLAQEVQQILAQVAIDFVSSVQVNRVRDAFDKASDQDRQAVATILRIDLTVPIPAQAVEALDE